MRTFAATRIHGFAVQWKQAEKSSAQHTGDIAMKKWILSTVAAGALAVGGAASAQDLGSVINSVIGSVFGTQQSYSYGTNTYYTDQYGRTIYVDQYGRHLIAQPNAGVTYDQWGRPVYNSQVYQGQVYQGQVYNGGYGSYGYSTAPQYPAYGTYGSGNYAYGYGTNSWDRDGDGISNSRDRWPDDRRYY
jgi:hypothetical protein